MALVPTISQHSVIQKIIVNENNSDQISNPVLLATTKVKIEHTKKKKEPEAVKVAQQKFYGGIKVIVIS